MTMTTKAELKERLEEAWAVYDAAANAYYDADSADSASYYDARASYYDAAYAYVDALDAYREALKALDAHESVDDDKN